MDVCLGLCSCFDDRYCWKSWKQCIQILKDSHQIELFQLLDSTLVVQRHWTQRLFLGLRRSGMYRILDTNIRKKNHLQVNIGLKFKHTSGLLYYVFMVPLFYYSIEVVYKLAHSSNNENLFPAFSYSRCPRSPWCLSLMAPCQVINASSFTWQIGLRTIWEKYYK